jgi:hypothetical protein
MKRFCMALLVGIALLTLLAARSDAASRYIQATNVATGAGICSITIESFDPNGAPEIHPMVVIPVSIPNGSIPDTTASRIRVALAAGLTPDFDVTLPPSTTGLVRVNRTAGGFTMSISENVPTQVIQEIIFPVPASGPVALYALSLALVAGGLFVLYRRRSSPSV